VSLGDTAQRYVSKELPYFCLIRGRVVFQDRTPAIRPHVRHDVWPCKRQLVARLDGTVSSASPWNSSTHVQVARPLQVVQTAQWIPNRSPATVLPNC
jgi:hypothetical protein